MPPFLREIRVAARAFAKSPAVAIAAVLSLAIGIGANTAIFTLTDRILLRSLPVKDPGLLVLFTVSGSMPGFIETPYGNEVSFSWPKYRALRDAGAGVFDGLIARFPMPVNIARQGRTQSGYGELVSGNYFEVLGVRPAVGRLFHDEDDRVRGGNPVAVLSYAFWTSRLGGDASVPGGTVLINAHPYTVVGVSGPGFRSFAAGEAPDVFVPMSMKAQITPGRDLMDDPHGYWLNIAGG